MAEQNLFACTFANKEMLFLNRNEISEEETGAEIISTKISPDKYFFTIHYDNGKSLEIPWDFVRFISDKNYGRRKENKGNLTAEEVGRRVKRAREVKNMTQDDLASKTGIIRNNISRVENGYHYPTLPVLEKIAEALGIPVVKLIAK